MDEDRGAEPRKSQQTGKLDAKPGAISCITCITLRSSVSSCSVQHGAEQAVQAPQPEHGNRDRFPVVDDQSGPRSRDDSDRDPFLLLTVISLLLILRGIPGLLLTPWPITEAKPYLLLCDWTISPRGVIPAQGGVVERLQPSGGNAAPRISPGSEAKVLRGRDEGPDILLFRRGGPSLWRNSPFCLSSVVSERDSQEPSPHRRSRPPGHATRGSSSPARHPTAAAGRFCRQRARH